MMSLISSCLYLLAILPASLTYSTGPPVSSGTVCTDMNPSGHGASAQTAASPFQVVTNQNCYKSGQTVQVVVSTLSSSSAAIEGLFVQARNTSGDTTALGTFTVSDSVLSSLTCTNANSAVGHNKEVKTYWREMTWTPPSGLTSDIKFRATVVEHQDTFWVGLESSTLTYNAGCAAGTSLTTTRIYGSGAAYNTPYVFAIVLTSFVVALFTM